MKVAFILVLATTGLLTRAEDIVFTNRVATFTNLQGQLYSHVNLVRGDLDGLIWREGASGGRVCYTNLHPDLLEDFGIPTNRIEVAKERTGKKALADARFRAQRVVDSRAKLSSQVATNRPDSALPWMDSPPVAVAAPNGSPPDSMYPVTYPYLFVPFDNGLPPAPSAASAPSAGSATGAASAGQATVSPGAGSVPMAPPAFNGTPATPAPRAPSAPPVRHR